jgi:hypothetical protein
MRVFLDMLGPALGRRILRQPVFLVGECKSGGAFGLTGPRRLVECRFPYREDKSESLLGSIPIRWLHVGGPRAHPYYAIVGPLAGSFGIDVVRTV